MGKRKTKAIAAVMMTAALMGAMSVTAFASGWQQNDKGRWYGTNEDNSQWYSNGWQWINDGKTLLIATILTQMVIF